ncbi:MAG: multiprotein bridging factor aMBF1 [Methanotrichaceae archaeon]
MQCEICGAEIAGKPNTIMMDGSELQVCKNCSRFGKAVDKFSPVPKKVVPRERTFQARRPKPRPRRDEFREMPELVSDYGMIVKKAREKCGLTPEKLGIKIKVKSSLIKKIERHEIVPEDSLRMKLEKELNIKLTDKMSDEKWNAGTRAKGTTLGDIASIKRK